MSDFRESAAALAQGLMEILVHGRMLDVSMVDATAYAKILRDSVELLDKVSDGELMTRDEFSDNLDLEAAAREMHEQSNLTSWQYALDNGAAPQYRRFARQILLAALGLGHNDD